MPPILTRTPATPRPARSSARSATLHERFDPRHNHLATMRTVLALTVACAHAMKLGFGHQPSIAGTELGDLAVDAFFVLSGFLLVGSYLRLDSIRRYVWHRFLRIMPGFWVCLLVTALLVAPVIAGLQHRPVAGVFTGPESAGAFLLRDATLMMRQFGVAGLPLDVPTPGVLNGSLWTLFYEALCYAGIVGLGLVGALRRRPAITLGVIVVLWALTALNATGPDVIGQERLLRFSLLFLIGAALCLYGHRIPVHTVLAAASAVLVVADLVWTPDYRSIAAPAFAYLCLWCAVVRPPTSPAPRSDLSYGLYVYHWPVLQILVVLGLSGLGPVVFIGTGLALALGAAYLSWHLVERPCLAFKDAAWVDAGRPR